MFFFVKLNPNKFQGAKNFGLVDENWCQKIIAQWRPFGYWGCRIPEGLLNPPLFENDIFYLKLFEKSNTKIWLSKVPAKEKT